MSPQTEPTTEKNVAAPKGKGEPVAVKQAPTPSISRWQKDMNRLMGDVLQSWSEFGQMSPFRDFLPEQQKTNGDITEWKEQADRYFDDLQRRWTDLTRMGPFDMFKAPTGFMLNPEVDISDGEDKLVVKAELPGMDKDDIEVELSDNLLTISGKKLEDTENEYTVRERRFGSFRRTFTLPEEAIASKMEAAFDKGVLTVTVPKKIGAPTKGKKVPVKG